MAKQVQLVKYSQAKGYVMGYAILKTDYLVDQDSSVAFDSPVIVLECPYRAINYQIKWESEVKGKMIWEASLFDDPFEWEQLINCEAVELDIPQDGDGNDHAIVSITDIWLTVGFIRFRFEPFSEGSTGNIDVAIRIVPA